MRQLTTVVLESEDDQIGKDVMQGCSKTGFSYVGFEDKS